MFRLFLALLCLCAFSIDAASKKSSITWQKSYLASYPRSGNHWVRYLVEEMTGVATGSVYCDPDPPHANFKHPWGGYLLPGGYEGNRKEPTPRDLILIKTHYPFWRCLNDRFDNAPIWCLVRHPIDAIYSLYAYRDGARSDLPIPTDFLDSAIKDWALFYNHWSKVPNILTTRYEDLTESPHIYLKQATKFLGLNIKPEDLNRAISRYPPNGNHSLKHLDKYTPQQVAKLKKELKALLDKFNYTIP